MNENTLGILKLKQISGLGDKNIKQLISYTGNFQNLLHQSKGQLSKIPGIGKKLVTTFFDKKNDFQIENILSECEKQDIKIVSYLDKDFPSRLKNQLDAPCILFVKGNGEMNPQKSVSIVGTRNATAYGKEVTQNIIKSLVSYDVQIISGMAYGIDVAAHKSALKEGLSTLAIMAGGHNHFYPAIHKNLEKPILEKGLIISENTPSTKPDAYLFPNRNRIIAGMSDAVIIVEAAKKGGALITGQIANSYNLPLFAVPGNLNNPYSEGTNLLIDRQVALIYTGIDSLLKQLNWEKQTTETQEKKQFDENFTPDESNIVNVLKNHSSPLHIDDIAIKSTMKINQVASILLSLEFKNNVVSLPGKKYKLK